MKTMFKSILLFTTALAASLANAQFSMPSASPKLILAINPKVQAHLKITDDQKKKINAVLDGIVMDMGDGKIGISLSGDTDLNDLDKNVMAVMDATQTERFDQLYCQREGYLALSRKEYADKIKVTEEQAKRLDVAWQHYTDAMQEFFSSNGPGSSEVHMTEADVEKMRAKTKKEVEEVLTKDQIDAWGKLLGEKFDFKDKGA